MNGLSCSRIVAFASAVVLGIASASARADIFAATCVADPSGSGQDIAVMNATLGTRVALPAVVNSADTELDPSISRDGRRLAFRRTSSTGVQRHLVVQLETGESADLFTGLEISRHRLRLDDHTERSFRLHRATVRAVIFRVLVSPSFPHRSAWFPERVVLPQHAHRESLQLPQLRQSQRRRGQRGEPVRDGGGGHAARQSRPQSGRRRRLPSAPLPQRRLLAGCARGRRARDSCTSSNARS